jgi:hypothetical protein
LRSLLILLISVFVLSGCVNGQTLKSSSMPSDSLTEKEIRGVLCDIENRNYANAQIALEKILRKEPQNIYAQRLLPGVLAEQINVEQKSAENADKIKKVIEAFEMLLKRADVSQTDKSYINDFIVSLIEKLDDKQKTAELLSRAENQTQNQEIRSKYYVALAAQAYSCANQITESVKKISKQNGKEIYVFSKPTKPEDFARLKECAAKGTEFIDKAINLNSKSENGWSYKASLLIQKVRIAEMEGNKEEKERLKKDYESAREKFLAVTDERIKNNNQSPEDAPQEKTNVLELAEELTVYKVERPVSELVKEVYIPVNKTLVELVSPEDDASPKSEEILKNSDSESKEINRKQKAEWKTFSPPEEEFSVELPDNVVANSSGNTVTYTAGAEGLDFMILSQTKPAMQQASFNDAVLNTLARSVVIPTGNLSMMGNGSGSFEAHLVSKENFNGQPARFYAYTNTSCSGKKEGVVILLIGKTKNFGIRLDGANERDPRFQRFLKSWKIVSK